MFIVKNSNPLGDTTVAFEWFEDYHREEDIVLFSLIFEGKMEISQNEVHIASLVKQSRQKAHPRVLALSLMEGYINRSVKI